MEKRIKLPRFSSDFQCFTCGAILANDEDRKQHLDKEAQGIMRDDTTEEEKETAKLQINTNKSYNHYF